jgi:hypothetical protein
VRILGRRLATASSACSPAKFSIVAKQFGAEATSSRADMKLSSELNGRSEEADAHVETGRRHADEHDQAEATNNGHRIDQNVVGGRSGFNRDFGGSIHFFPLEKKFMKLEGES